MSPTFFRRVRLTVFSVLCATLAACGGSDDNNNDESARANEPMPTPNAQMQAVLNELVALGAKPIETLTVAQARAQPLPADAV